VALADGLTEETTTAMARLPGVFVTARQSCMVYKNAAVDARTIASDLGVRYLVEGSIEVRGRSVRVNARLIDGRSGLHIWANNYEEQLGEFFAVRNRIVLAVASQLQPALMVADLDRALDAGPTNLDAWTRLQRANAHVLFNRSAQSLFSAITELKQALAIDPDYAMAAVAACGGLYLARDLVGIDANCGGARARPAIRSTGSQDGSQKFICSDQLRRYRDLLCGQYRSGVGVAERGGGTEPS
jgi:TolB-like protein